VEERSNEILKRERKRERERERERESGKGKEAAAAANVELAPPKFRAYQKVLLSIRTDADIRYCGRR